MIIVERIEEVSKKSAICFLITFNILYAITPLYLLIIGCFNITTCPGNHILPLWMIGVAILIIIHRVIFWKVLINETKFEKSFPRPEVDDYDQIKTWEKDRMKSSPKILVLARTNLGILFFLAVIFGALWSYHQLFKKDECAPIVSFSVFGFSLVGLIVYLVSFIGTLYIFCVHWLTKLDQRAKSSLNRVL